MRIVQVVLSLEVGGQERLLVRMAQALHEAGHRLHVVTLTTGGSLRQDLSGIRVHDVTKLPGLDRTLYTRLYRLFREVQPDVVHTHNAVPLEYAAPAARVARVRRVVHTKHGHIPYSRAALQLARLASRFVHHFVAVSEDTANTARRYEHPSEKKLTVIENGIPLKRFAHDAVARKEVRAELGIPPQARVVGSVGRLVEEKDYHLLVEAMGPLLADDLRLVLVGEGDVRPTIEAAIAKLPAEKRGYVTLTGARRDVPRVLSAYDLFALSSNAEGLPLVIPEAMASGLPVVATSVGGIPGIVPPETGTLVPSRDVPALRKALSRFLADDGLRNTAAEAARKYALGRFAEERMLEKYLALYARR